MKVERYVMGLFQTNTYLLIEGDEAIVIDPACKAEKLIEILGEKKLIGILLTHGHLDHIKAVDGLIKHYGCKAYLNEGDRELSQDKSQGKPFGIMNSPVINSGLESLNDGLLNIGPFIFEVTHTPGHTEGSVVIRCEDHLFTGDTLFHLSVGRTDLEGGNNSKLKSSLRIIAQMDDKLIVHPGHEEESTLEIEKQYNPFMN